MMSIYKNTLVTCFFLLWTVISHAADHGSAKDAEALVAKAVAHLKANGRDKAFTDFNDSKGEFVFRDLYIYVLDLDGFAYAHGSNKKLIGKDLKVLRDIDNKAFINDILNLAKTKGKGWVDYKWPNPGTKELESKSTYFEKYDNLVVACGIYK